MLYFFNFWNFYFFSVVDDIKQIVLGQSLKLFIWTLLLTLTLSSRSFLAFLSIPLTFFHRIVLLRLFLLKLLELRKLLLVIRGHSN